MTPRIGERIPKLCSITSQVSIKGKCLLKSFLRAAKCLLGQGVPHLAIRLWWHTGSKRGEKTHYFGDQGLNFGLCSLTSFVILDIGLWLLWSSDPRCGVKYLNGYERTWEMELNEKTWRNSLQMIKHHTIYKMPYYIHIIQIYMTNRKIKKCQANIRE